MDMQSVDMTVLPEVAAEAPVATPATQSNWLDSVKERFSGQEPWAIELVVFGLGGFVAGFLLKNFGRIALMVIAAALIAILVLHYTHVYEMPFERLQAFLGISDINSMQELLQAKMVWCKEHPVALISGLVGLLVGWKVG